MHFHSCCGVVFNYYFFDKLEEINHYRLEIREIVPQIHRLYLFLKICESVAKKVLAQFETNKKSVSH